MVPSGLEEEEEPTAAETAGAITACAGVVAHNLAFQHLPNNLTTPIWTRAALQCTTRALGNKLARWPGLVPVLLKAVRLSLAAAAG